MRASAHLWPCALAVLALVRAPAAAAQQHEPCTAGAHSHSHALACAVASPMVLFARLRSVSMKRTASTYQVRRVLEGPHDAPPFAQNETLRFKHPNESWAPFRIDGIYLLQAERPRGQRQLRLIQPPILKRCLPARFFSQLRRDKRNNRAEKCRAPNEEFKPCDLKCPMCDRNNCVKCVPGCFCKAGFKKEQGKCIPVGKGSTTRLEISPANTRVLPKEHLELDCNVTRGGAHSLLVWYKDGKPINSSRITMQQTKRKHARLTISKTELEDSGTYECRMGNLVARTNVTVKYESVFQEASCKKAAADSFCHNGGTCFFIPEMNETSCRCTNDYHGEHCEYKVVLSSNND